MQSSSIPSFTFSPNPSPLKLDLSFFQSHLNTNLSQINTAIQYLFTQITHQEVVTNQIEGRREIDMEKQRGEIQSVRMGQKELRREIYGQEEQWEEGWEEGDMEGQDGDERKSIRDSIKGYELDTNQPRDTLSRKKTETKPKRISKINTIQNQITKLKQVIKQDKQKKQSLLRLQSRGKTVNGEQKITIGMSQIRIKENSRGREGGSKMESRKRLTNEIIEKKCNNNGEGEQRDGNVKYEGELMGKSMTTSFIKKKGSRGCIGFKERNDDEQEDKMSRSSMKRGEIVVSGSREDGRVDEEMQKRLKEIERNYQKRFEMIEKRLKIKNKHSIITSQDNKQSNPNSNTQQQPSNQTQNQPQLQNQNQTVSPSSNNLSHQPRPQSSPSQPWSDPFQSQLHSLQTSVSLLTSKLHQHQAQLPQLSKRTSDILLKSQKNHQRVTAALKYLQRNINKIFDKLKQADIMGEDEVIEGEGKDGKRRDRISQLVRLNGMNSEQEKLVNRLQTLDNLVKNIEDEMVELKYQIGIKKPMITLPRINNGKENVIRVRQFQSNPPDINLKLNDIDIEIDKIKVKLKSVAVSSDEATLKVMDLSSKIRQQSELKQQHVTQLIKEIVNRTLADPFDNHFTNQLKKEIYVKFLEIKHEYGAIWKEIEKKVEDRVGKKEMEYLGERVESGVLEVKAGLGKKVDLEDNRKWVKYVEGRLKELGEGIRMSESNQWKMVQEHTLSIKKKERESGRM